VAKIAGEEVANGVPIEKRWLRLKHRTGRPSNFGKARLLVSVDFDPVGPVRHSTPFTVIMELLEWSPNLTVDPPALLNDRCRRFLMFNPMHFAPQEGVGKRAEEYSWENKHAYFPPRRGNRVTLYADAHTVAEPLPPIPLAGGRQWHQASCWDDLFAAIAAAKHFIYIAGMSRAWLCFLHWCVDAVRSAQSVAASAHEQTAMLSKPDFL